MRSIPAFSFVSQDNFLFNTSIYDNIKVGKPDATKEEVLAAAQKAQCMEFINRLGKRYLHARGRLRQRAFGGERQRVSLARAILKNAPVVILDEATAFADPENEEKMEKAIAEVVRGKTLLVIAHRLASIQNADRIYVLDSAEWRAAARIKSFGKQRHIQTALADLRGQRGVERGRNDRRCEHAI